MEPLNNDVAGKCLSCGTGILQWENIHGDGPTTFRTLCEDCYSPEPVITDLPKHPMCEFDPQLINHE